MIESLYGGQLPQKLFETHCSYFMNKNKPLLDYITESSKFFCYGIIQFILTNISSSWPVLYGKDAI